MFESIISLNQLRKEDVIIQLDSVVIQSSETVRDVGVQMDNRLMMHKSFCESVLFMFLLSSTTSSAGAPGWSVDATACCISIRLVLHRLLQTGFSWTSALIVDAIATSCSCCRSSRCQFGNVWSCHQQHKDSALAASMVQNKISTLHDDAGQLDLNWMCSRWTLGTSRTRSASKRFWRHNCSSWHSLLVKTDDY